MFIPLPEGVAPLQSSSFSLKLSHDVVEELYYMPIDYKSMPKIHLLDYAYAECLDIL